MIDDVDKRLTRALEQLVIEGYVARGRVHKAAETEELKQAFPRAYTDWGDDHSIANSDTMENIQGELLLRGITVSPKDAAPEAHARIIAEIGDRVVNPEAIDHPLLSEILAKMAERPN